MSAPVDPSFAYLNHLFQAKLGFQDMPFQLYPNQRMDMLDNTQRSVNLRYAGQFDWGTLEARAYQEKVDHFMDFGADKRYWYGNGVPPVGSAPSRAKRSFTSTSFSAAFAA